MVNTREEIHNNPGVYLEFARIGHRRLELDGINQGLSQGNVLDSRIIEPIHVVPNCSVRCPKRACQDKGSSLLG